MAEQLYQIENGIVISIPSDTKKVIDGVRESFKYLDGLLELDILYSTLSPSTKSKLSEGIESLRKELQKLELASPDSKNQLATFSDYDKLKELYKRYIELKEKADRFQIDILNELIDISYQTLLTLTKKRDNLKEFLAQIYSSLMTKSAFLHSHDEDKKIIYFLLIDDEKFDTTINPFEKYIHIEVSDYSFNLYRERSRFQHMYGHLMQLIFSIADMDNKKNIDSLVAKQYSLNKQVVRLTYVITILTIIMAVVSIFQISHLKK